MKSILTIAGSDCSGGAGIQGDLKTIAALGMYGMAVITAVTAQNTFKYYGGKAVESELLKSQLDAVFADISPKAVKIGMVANGELGRVIGEKLKEYNVKNVVFDPVMSSTTGGVLLDKEEKDALIKGLFPYVHVLTPNFDEAEALSGIAIKNKEDMVKSAAVISKFFNGYVLLKAGHSRDCADDLLYWNGGIQWYSAERIDNPNTHGTGCALSTAIACFLGAGFSVEEAVRKGKDYLTGAIEDGLDLGKGIGPLNHLYRFFPQNKCD